MNSETKGEYWLKNEKNKYWLKYWNAKQPFIKFWKMYENYLKFLEMFWKSKTFLLLETAKIGFNLWET